MQPCIREELMYHYGISAVAICCCLAESKYVLLDPDKLEEQVDSHLPLSFWSVCFDDKKHIDNMNKWREKPLD